MPPLTLDSFTQNILKNMKLGGFEVKIQTNDKQILEGFLLLKTNDFYYINPIINGKKISTNTTIISTQNTTLIYQTAESQSADSNKK